MKFYKKIILVTFLTLLPFLVCEVTLRIVDYKLGNPYVSNPDLGYSFKPGYIGPSPQMSKRFTEPRDITLKINALGFRGNEVSNPKPWNTIRIASLGDSCTFGLGIDQDKTYTAKLEQTLRGHDPSGKRFEVLNAGVPGYTSHQGLVILKTQALSLDLDLITLYFGWNDHWFADSGLPDRISIPRMRKNALKRLEISKNNPLLQLKFYPWFSTRVMGLYRKFDRKVNFEGKDYRVPQDHFVQNLKDMIQLAQQNNIQVLLITPPHGFESTKTKTDYGLENHIAGQEILVDLHLAYVQRIREVAQETGALLVDIEKTFGENGRFKFMEKDGIHPNELGNEVIGNELYKAIQNLPRMKGSGATVSHKID